MSSSHPKKHINFINHGIKGAKYSKLNSMIGNITTATATTDTVTQPSQEKKQRRFKSNDSFENIVFSPHQHLPNQKLFIFKKWDLNTPPKQKYFNAVLDDIDRYLIFDAPERKT